MQKWLRLTGVITLSVGLMLGCSNDDRSDNEEEGMTQGEAEQDIDSETESTSEGLPEKKDFSTEDASSTSEDDTSKELLDLSIGESAVIETTIGTAEVTLTGVTIQDTFEDESPELDLFVLANVTVTNMSEHPQSVNDIVSAFEITPDLEGSGYSEISTHYEIDTWEGELEPNETAEGQLLYQSVESPQQIIRVNPGLISAEAVKQDVRWTFTEEDSE